ncbi:MAG: L,D-transpeptidase [Gemmatimonadaceae bacterium]
MNSFLQPFRDDAKIAWGLLGATVLLLVGSGALLASTADLRFERDIHRIGFNRNWEFLRDLVRRAGIENDSLQGQLGGSQERPGDRPYLVVSIEDRRLWYKRGDSTIFSTQVAVGSGKTLVKAGTREEFKFDTPRGRLVVQNKEIDPVWVPPDWHYMEQAKKKGLGVVRLTRGQQIPTSDGGVISVDGTDVVKKTPTGELVRAEAGEGRELIAGGNIIIPPFGTSQRKFEGVLGTHRLNLGDGYALHGTDKPQSIGQAVSHGCVRLRNEDIAYLYEIVPAGTSVFIY